jgi:hypothetical protein
MELWPDCTCCHGAPLPRPTPPVPPKSPSQHKRSGHTTQMVSTYFIPCHSKTHMGIACTAAHATRSHHAAKWPEDNTARAPMAHASVAHTHVRSLLLQGAETHPTHKQLSLLSPSQTQTHITTDRDSQHTHTQVRTESQPLSAQGEAEPKSGKWTVGEWAHHAPVQPSPTTTGGVALSISASLTSFGAINNSNAFFFSKAGL